MEVIWSGRGDVGRCDVGRSDVGRFDVEGGRDGVRVMWRGVEIIWMGELVDG